MPKTSCSEPRCPEFAVYKGRCRQHSRERNRASRQVGRRVYHSKRWLILRERKLANDPLCERGCGAIATDVHHKHGVERDPWSMDGLESLCARCHGMETRREQLEDMPT